MRHSTNMATSKRRISRRLGYAIGAIIFIGGGSVLFFGTARAMRMPGPPNTGHSELACESCHRPAPGTFRQQAQANARWILGLRDAPVEVGALPVASAACTECHVRPNDRHPAFRFLEPRFQEAREAMALDRCASCHREHRGQRVTAELNFCRHCHADLVLARDPLDYSHELIVRTEQWDRCLGCHDFHGNHDSKAPVHVSAGADAGTLLNYFKGTSESPYGPAKVHAVAAQR